MKTTHYALTLLGMQLASAFGFCPSVQAAEDNTAVARALFTKARRLAAEGRYDLACPLFDQSRRLHDGIGIQFNLADCWEGLGRVTSAWNLFLEVAERAEEQGDPIKAKVARERAAMLEPSLPYLRIEINEAPPGLVLVKGEEPIPAEQWGTSIPADPGEYRVEATAPGHVRYQTKVNVPADGGVVELRIPALDPAVQSEPEAAAFPALSESAQADPPSASIGDSPLGLRGWSQWVAVGAGGVALTGIAFGVGSSMRAGESFEQAGQICLNSALGCTRAEVRRHDVLVRDGRRWEVYSQLGYAIGIAGAVAGVALILWPDESEPDEAELGIALSPGGVGAQLRGAF